MFLSFDIGGSFHNIVEYSGKSNHITSQKLEYKTYCSNFLKSVLGLCCVSMNIWMVCVISFCSGSLINSQQIHNILYVYCVTSVTLGQPHDCWSASEITLMHKSAIDLYQTTALHNKMHNLSKDPLYSIWILNIW